MAEEKRELFSKINSDLSKAMKEKNELRLSTLRMMKSKILYVNARGDLSDAEIIKILIKFSKELKEEGIDSTPYRVRFDDLIAWNMPLQDNRAIVVDEAKGIILEKSMQKYLKKLPLKPTRFNWKWVGWGLTSLKVDVAALKEAAKRENVVQAYSTTTKMIETAEKLQKLVEMSPDVIDFKELRRKSSD